jgi:predicted Zn-dependent peptidase
MSAAGGENNAFTTADITDYYDEGPPTALPLLLWLEADRLRDLGQLMTKAKLDAQREVVLNERRQSHENQPYGKVELRLPELLYNDGHPYHHPVIGSPEDLNPGAPGFDDTKTTLTQVVRETIPDRVELPEIVMAWQSPKRFAPGDAELSLYARILASGKESRLYKSLVYEKKLAQTVTVVQDSGHLGSQFTVTVLARPGVSLDKLEAAIDTELSRPRPVSETELTRAKNETETGMVDELEPLMGRAVALAMYQMSTGNPGYLPTDLARYRQATADGVQRAAAATLDLEKRVILRVVPEEAEKNEKTEKKTGGAK